MIHLHLPQCQSTQQMAIAKIGALGHQELLISTENQLAGQGRRKNKWTFYPNSLAFSFTMPPSPAPQLAAMEVAALFCSYVTEDVTIKWPNDLILEGRKCAGILCQLIRNLVIVGMGINIANKPLDAQPDFTFPPGALPWQGKELQKTWPKDFYRFVLNNRLDTQTTLKQFQQYCDHLNQPVATDKAGLQGIFTGIGNSGEALIKDGSKEHRLINGSLFYR